MIIFVGDKPSPRMKPGDFPFEGAACQKRLNNWLGELQLYRCMVVDAYHSGAPQVQLINQSDLTDMEFLLNYSSVDKFVAFGNNASNRLKSLDIPHFKLPHPSGRNRQINDKEFIKNKLEECSDWLMK